MRRPKSCARLLQCVPFVLVLVLVGIAIPAEAGPFVKAGDIVEFDDSWGTTGGGEFLIEVNDAWSFITFCLQKTEFINFKDPFRVDDVTKYAVTDPADKGGDALGRDFISEHTAFLYTRFTEGTLTGYDYANNLADDGKGRADSADLLQKAIWMFEGEIAMSASNKFVVLANTAITGGLWSGTGHVRVLNLSRNGIEAQDQLTIVPEPGSMMLLGTGIAVAAARRRRARRQRD